MHALERQRKVYDVNPSLPKGNNDVAQVMSDSISGPRMLMVQANCFLSFWGGGILFMNGRGSFFFFFFLKMRKKGTSKRCPPPPSVIKAMMKDTYHRL